MLTKEQIEERRTGVGGSDAPVIYKGEHYGRTVRDLYHEKVDGEGQDISHLPDIRRGNRQEAVALAVTEEVLGMIILPVREMVRSATHPFMIAHLDGILPEGDERIPIEVKCPRLSTFMKWKREGIPEGALIQGQHYLAVTGSPRMVYAVYSAEIDDLMTVPVKREESIIDNLIALEADFWQMVQDRVPPVWTPPAPPVDMPTVKGTVVDMGASIAWQSAIATLRSARDLKAEAEELEAKAKEVVQEIMDGNPVVEGAGARVYWQEQAGRKTLDKKALKRDGIDIEKYEKVGQPFKVFKTYYLRQGE